MAVLLCPGYSRNVIADGVCRAMSKSCGPVPTWAWRTCQCLLAITSMQHDEKEKLISIWCYVSDYVCLHRWWFA